MSLSPTSLRRWMVRSPLRSLPVLALMLVVLAGVATAPARAQSPDAVPQQSIFPDLTGSALIDALRQSYAPDQTLGYDVARDSLYRYLDDTRGTLVGVYGGYEVDIPPNEDPSFYAYQNGSGLSAEHTWPQSKGAGDEPERSDMHNLFPVKQTINAARSNAPFADIPDAETDTWYRLDQEQSSVPTTSVDSYSEDDGRFPSSSYSARFEPREDHKGNAARAVFYFHVVHAGAVSDPTFFDAQKDALLRWHSSDPVDAGEYDRSAWIASKQGTANPFIVDTTLVRRAFQTSSTRTVQFAGRSTSVPEGDAGSQTTTVSVTLSAANTSQTVTADVSVVGGTAATGTDASLETTSVSFPTGSTTAQSVDLTVYGDTDGEPDETVELQLSNVRGAALGATSTHVVTITDDDSAPAATQPLITEIMQNPSAVSDSDGEWFEIYNPSSQSVDLQGWSVEDTDSDAFTVSTSVSVPAGGFAVFCKNATSSQNGGLSCDYEFPGSFYVANGDDELILRDASGTEVDRVAYDGGPNWPDPNGASMAFTGTAGEDNADPANWTTSTAREGRYTGDSGDLGSPGAAGTVQTLPVELAAFTAAASGPRRVRVVWTTASETGNAGFYVERRIGQRGADEAWTEVGFREGQGTTTSAHRYRFDDTVPFATVSVQYRLRQVDADGTAHLSRAVSVVRTAPSASRLLAPYPNPARRHVTLPYAVPQRQEVAVSVYDVLGREVVSRPVGPRRGRHELTLDVSSLSSGVYVVRLTAGPSVHTRRLTVVR